MELNREKIVKALECCAKLKPCKECPLYTYSHDDEGCKHKCIVDALALIRELTEEKERLSNDKSYWKKRAESRELEHDKAVKKGYAFGKADTVRKMHRLIGERLITEVAEELLEEQE